MLIAIVIISCGTVESKLVGNYISEDRRYSLELRGDGTYTYKVKAFTASFDSNSHLLGDKSLIDETGEWRVVKSGDEEFITNIPPSSGPGHFPDWFLPKWMNIERSPQGDYYLYKEGVGKFTKKVG